MKSDIFELAAIGMALIVCVILIGLCITFPFFLVGWALTLVGAIFSGVDVAVGYWANTGMGLAAVIVVAVIRSLLGD